MTTLGSVLDEKPVQGSNWVHGDVLANQITIHYYRTGGKGPSVGRPPLVLSHGFSDNGLCWIRAAKALEKEYDLIMPDARGHGLSSAPEDGYDDHMRAADVAGFVTALGLEKPALMGHSMGAASTAMAAAEFGDLFSCAILEDPPWFAGDSPWGRMPRQSVEERRAQIEAQKAKPIEEIIADGRKQRPTWDEIEWQPWGESKKQLSPNAAGRHAGPRPEWREVVKKITIPALLVIGDPEQRSIVTPETAQQAAELNPLIEVVQLQGAGHNIRREQFEPFIEAVTAFLKKHDR